MDACDRLPMVFVASLSPPARGAKPMPTCPGSREDTSNVHSILCDWPKKPRDLATGGGLRLVRTELELAPRWQTARIGVMLGAAVTILLADIAVIPPIVQWIVRA
jgi:hypothetical protein